VRTSLLARNPGIKFSPFYILFCIPKVESAQLLEFDFSMKHHRTKIIGGHIASDRLRRISYLGQANLVFSFQNNIAIFITLYYHLILCRL
jgi:hypothetical protein